MTVKYYQWKKKKKIGILAEDRHNIFVVHGFKPTTKLKLVERTEALRVLTLLAVVASPRTGGVQGCRLAAAADPEITPEHQSCRHLASTNPPATSTVRITGPGHSQARWIFCGLPSDGEEAGSTKYQLRNHTKVWGEIYVFIAGCDMKIFFVEGTLFCSAYHRLVPGEQDIFCDDLNYQVCADFHMPLQNEHITHTLQHYTAY